MAMIEIRNVSKWYGSFQVLTNCTTSVEKGEVIEQGKNIRHKTSEAIVGGRSF